MPNTTRLLVCTPGQPADAYGHLSKLAHTSVQTARSMGIQANVLDAAADGFLRDFFTALDDPDCVINFNYFQYDLRVLASVGRSKVTHALERSRARTVATIADHPFSGFMREQLANAHPSTRFILIESGFRDEALFVNGALETASMVHIPFVPPVNFDPQQRRPYNARSIDLVVPLFITPMPAQSVKNLLDRCTDRWLRRAVEATYEAVVRGVPKTPFQLLDAFAMGETGMTLPQMKKAQPAALQAFLTALEELDAMARQQRRQQALNNLLKSVGDLKVCVLGKKTPQLSVDESVQFVGIQQVNEAMALCGQSRALLNCNPSYPTNIHERISVGMLYGACVITDVNPCIESTFKKDAYVPIDPASSAPLAEIFKTNDIEGIAAAGLSAISADPRFSWETHVRNILECAT